MIHPVGNEETGSKQRTRFYTVRRQIGTALDSVSLIHSFSIYSALNLSLRLSAKNTLGNKTGFSVF